MDKWALWSDGFMCPATGGEIYEAMSPPCARSDDFEIVYVTEYGPDGEPFEWTKEQANDD